MYNMIYTSKVTSKGTTTIPADIREELGLRPGSEVRFEKDPKTGRVSLERVPSIDELRARAKQEMIQAGTWGMLKNYKSGDGFTAHVQEKYGTSQR
jgi:AbrB family looped-hinge helix DNA binding protein